MIMRAHVASLLLVMASIPAGAADYYVSTSGSDANAGSQALPFRTIAKGLATAQAGDVVLVRGGTYVERPSFPRSGTAPAPITLRSFPGESPILEMASLTVPAGNGDEAVIRITNKSHITVQGFTIRNWVTTDPGALPEGILVNATGGNAVTNVRLIGNTIYNVQQNSPDTFAPGDAHGIKVAGRSTTAMSGIVIDGNTLHDLHTGTSESLVVNGNVSGFRITNNVVHDCNNIGIDMIGYEGSLSATINRARDGICAGNVVYNIDARFNPGYNGSLTSGGGDPSAAGIYVDGGTNIIIERNLVYACNFGMEIATEADLAAGAKADFITVRDNLIRHNHQTGLLMGGYNSSRGTTENCLFINNTIYQNGTFGATVQIFGQHNVQSNVFRNNVVVAGPGTRLVVGVYPGSAVTTFSSNTFSNNLYYSAAGAPVFDVQGNKSLSQWQSTTSLSGGDNGSTAEDPLFEERDPTSATPVPGYAPAAGSPMIGTGQITPPYHPGSGETDMVGHSRLRGGRVDRGAFEK